MADATVEWQGLTKMLLTLKEKIPAACQSTLHEMTTELGAEALELYKQNLNGGNPSTDSDPLPVGVRTGELLAGARLVITNQYAFKLTNDVPYAGFLEDGTSKMAPRHPLQNAVDVMSIRYQAEAGKAMTTITEAQ